MQPSFHERNKEFLYLRWTEHHLRAYFETLVTLFQINDFCHKLGFFCEADFVVKMY